MPLSPIFFVIFPLKAAYTSHRGRYIPISSLFILPLFLVFFNLPMHKGNVLDLVKMIIFSFYPTSYITPPILYNSQRNTFNFSLDKPLNILYNDLVVRDN